MSKQQQALLVQDCLNHMTVAILLGWLGASLTSWML